MASIEDLPNEILLKIFKQDEDQFHLVTLSTVCKRWRRVIASPDFWRCYHHQWKTEIPIDYWNLDLPWTFYARLLKGQDNFFEKNLVKDANGRWTGDDEHWQEFNKGWMDWMVRRNRLPRSKETVNPSVYKKYPQFKGQELILNTWFHVSRVRHFYSQKMQVIDLAEYFQDPKKIFDHRDYEVTITIGQWYRISEKMEMSLWVSLHDDDEKRKYMHRIRKYGCDEVQGAWNYAEIRKTVSLNNIRTMCFVNCCFVDPTNIEREWHTGDFAQSSVTISYPKLRK